MTMRSLVAVTNRTVPVTVSATLSPKVLAAVHKHAKEREISRNAAVAELVQDGLNARRIFKQAINARS